jgi:hypothetical protein
MLSIGLLAGEEEGAETGACQWDYDMVEVDNGRNVRLNEGPRAVDNRQSGVGESVDD